MIVITVDQVNSRHEFDRIPTLLETLTTSTTQLLERTAGDEAQGVFSDPGDALRVILWAIRDGHWHLGIGAGQATVPAGDTPRAGSGPAFIAAREAVEAAKSELNSIAVRSQSHPIEASQLESLLKLYAALAQRRTPRQWEIIDAFIEGGSGKGAAELLAVTAQTISQSLQASAWREEAGTYGLALELLKRISR
ncbi:hypothetical protein [Schaalia vaccimaxillae]|uniref:hypothetical protein n=1 Tax=Schaalia vaccimaxillae TaxID=183916 RepID=UPI0003B3858B|nr:hypothetical protein [Schaalia vaccimaxillae]